MLTVPNARVAGGGAKEAAELSCSRKFSPLDKQHHRRTKNTHPHGTSEREKNNNSGTSERCRVFLLGKLTNKQEAASLVFAWWKVVIFLYDFLTVIISPDAQRG